MQVAWDKSKAIYSLSSRDQQPEQEHQPRSKTTPEKLRQLFSRWLDTVLTDGRILSQYKRVSYDQSATVSSH